MFMKQIIAAEDTVDLERLAKVKKYLVDIDEVDGEKLTDKQREFVAETRDRLESEGDTLCMTDRQYGYLKGCWQKQTGRKSLDPHEYQEEV